MVLPCCLIVLAMIVRKGVRPMTNDDKNMTCTIQNSDGPLQMSKPPQVTIWRNHIWTRIWRTFVWHWTNGSQSEIYALSC